MKRFDLKQFVETARALLTRHKALYPAIAACAAIGMVMAGVTPEILVAFKHQSREIAYTSVPLASLLMAATMFAGSVIAGIIARDKKDYHFRNIAACCLGIAIGTGTMSAVQHKLYQPVAPVITPQAQTTTATQG